LAAVTVWAAPLGALDVVTLNLLNGIACTRPGAGDGHQCRVHDRLALLLQHLVAASCQFLAQNTHPYMSPEKGRKALLERLRQRM
jgi:hypothetical protein